MRSHYTSLAVAMFFCASTGVFAQHERLPQIETVGKDATINCASAPVQIGVTIENWIPGFHYSWQSGETDSVIFVKPASTTTYELLITHDLLGIYAVRAFKISVKNDPVLTEPNSFLVDKFTCPGKDVTLNFEMSGGYPPYKYEWSNGSEERNPVVQPLKNTSYLVTVTDRCGSKAYSEVKVEFQPHDPILIPQQTVINYPCEGDEVKIWPRLHGIKGGVGYGYIYSFSDWSAANKAIEVEAVDGAHYMVKVTDACKMDVAEARIILEKSPLILPELSDIHACKDAEVELIRTEEPHLFYWDGHEMHTSYTTVADGITTYPLTYLDQCGNSHIITRKVIADEVSSDFDYDVHASSNQVELFPLVQDPSLTYQWIVNGEAYSLMANESVQLQEGSTNEVTLEVLDKNGCFSSTTKVVKVRDNISIPSAFSPNDDGSNDYFSLQMDEEFSEFNLKIFNRWGQLVYETNDQYFAWDGGDLSASELLNTFVYSMKGKTTTGKTIDKVGTLTIIN